MWTLFKTRKRLIKNVADLESKYNTYKKISVQLQEHLKNCQKNHMEYMAEVKDRLTELKDSQIFYRRAYNNYEDMKMELLNLQRENKDDKKQIILVHKINALSFALGKGVVDASRPETLVCYPDSKFKS